MIGTGTRLLFLCGLVALIVMAGVPHLTGCGHASQLPAGADTTIAAHFMVRSIIPLPGDVGENRRTSVHLFQGEWFILPPYGGRFDTFPLIRIGPAGTDSILLAAPDRSLLDRRSELMGFDLDERHIVVLYWNAVFIYERTPEGVEQPRIIRLDSTSHYRAINLDGGRWFLSSSTINDDRPEKTWVCEIDVEKGGILWERSFPDPHGIEFTAFTPRRIMQVTQDEIFLADLDRYRILVYDHAGHVADSIVRQIPGWSTDTSYMRHSPVNDPNSQGRALIEALREAAYGRPNLRLITLLDSSTLMVTAEYPLEYTKGSLPKNYLFLHDLWQRSGGKWTLAAADIPDFKTASDMRWDDARMRPLSIAYKRFGEGVIGAIEPYSVYGYEGKTYGRIQQELDSFLFDNEPQYAIFEITRRK